MYGQELAKEIGKRRGKSPPPGTLYPALKTLEQKGFIQRKKVGKKIKYVVTGKGKAFLQNVLNYFRTAFKEMMK